MKSCPFCGAAVEQDATFCHHCMHSLTEKQALTPYRRRPKWAVLLPVITVIATALLFIAIKPLLFSEKKTPDTNPTTTTTIHSGAVQNATSGTLEHSSAPTTSSNTTTSKVLTATTTKLSQKTTTTTSSAETAATTTTTTAKSTTPTTSKARATTTAKPSQKTTATTSSTKIVTMSTTTTTTTATTTTSAPLSPFVFKTIDGGVEIVGITDVPSDGVCTIPSTINGKPVVRIGDYAFKYNKNLTAITIPATVTSVGINAFTECSNLSAIYICSTNINIHAHAFSTHHQRKVDLTIYAPAGVLDDLTAQLRWDAEYVEWNG